MTGQALPHPRDPQQLLFVERAGTPAGSLLERFPFRGDKGLQGKSDPEPGGPAVIQGDKPKSQPGDPKETITKHEEFGVKVAVRAAGNCTGCGMGVKT